MQEHSARAAASLRTSAAMLFVGALLFLSTVATRADEAATFEELIPVRAVQALAPGFKVPSFKSSA